jgi:O6-methylguanine-DNA--protein-cysteine methyltransferase
VVSFWSPFLSQVNPTIQQPTDRPTDRPAPKMPRSDEAQAFFFMVYRAVQEVPEGKVTSYGHIAKLIGLREFSPLSPCFPSLLVLLGVC